MKTHDHSRIDRPRSGSFWTSRVGIAFIVFLAIGGLLLGYEHRVHIFTSSGVLIGLLALCIVVHLFMHGGHGGHGSGDSNTDGGGRS